jgi:hypothetical protein
MPPPKIIGQSFARKKNIVKEFQRRKNNVAKEKTKHFFV